MKLTYYGHACFAVETQGQRLLFDPFISPNELAKDIVIDNIKADYILLSHGHGDHMADALQIAANNNATIIACYEICSWYAEKHNYAKGHPMNLGGTRDFEFGTVKFVNAVHSSVLPDGTYGGNPGGFVVKNNEGAFYYAGDTALTMDMQLIPRHATLDFAVLPIGDNFTMGVDDAVVAAQMIGCKRIVGVHYDTFGYIKIDRQKAVEKFAQAGCQLLLPDIGSSIDL